MYSQFEQSEERSRPGKQCIALLASSSIIFMLIWLGLLFKEYEVLLIAYVSSE